MRLLMNAGVGKRNYLHFVRLRLCASADTSLYQSSVKTPTFGLWDVDGVRVDSKIRLDFSLKMWYTYSITVADIHSVTAW